MWNCGKAETLVESANNFLEQPRFLTFDHRTSHWKNWNKKNIQIQPFSWKCWIFKFNRFHESDDTKRSLNLSPALFNHVRDLGSIGTKLPPSWPQTTGWPDDNRMMEKAGQHMNAGWGCWWSKPLEVQLEVQVSARTSVVEIGKTTNYNTMCAMLLPPSRASLREVTWAFFRAFFDLSACELPCGCESSHPLGMCGVAWSAYL